jgi:hypothetical protein
MKRIVLLLAILTMVTGCTSARISSQFSAGHVPCRSENIIITEETADAITGMHNWIAECKGKKYTCSYHYGDGSKCTALKTEETVSEGMVDLKKQSKSEANPTDSSEYAQRLRELKKLKDEGLLTDKEYEQKRKSIVDGM